MISTPTRANGYHQLVAARLLVAEGRTRGRLWRTGPELFPPLGQQFGLKREDSDRGSILALVAHEVVGQARAVVRAEDDRLS